MTLTIDGRKVTVKKGTLLVEAAKQLGRVETNSDDGQGPLDIPVFCYHSKLKPVGACRMCLVEIEKMPRLQTACTTPVADGMVVKTKSDMATGGQQAVISMLLSNHPLDCPVCDKGGECPLQDNTFEHGPGVSRFEEEKRHKDKAFELSEKIVLDRERCILCYRCVRFHDEVPGDRALSVIHRGNKGEIGVLEGEAYTSPFQGNTIDICPVGALTSRQYRFRSRPWDLKSTRGVAVDDPVGSNVFIDSRDGRVLRLRPRENLAVNDAWIGDRTRFATVPVEREERLQHPLVRQRLVAGGGGKLVAATWFEAVRKAGSLLRNQQVGLVLSPALSNEAYAVVQETQLGTASLATSLSAWPVQGTLQNLRNSKSVVVVGCDPWTEMPVLALQIRKAIIPVTHEGIARGGGGSLVVVGPENGLFRDSRAWLKSAPTTEDVVEHLEDLIAGLEGQGSDPAKKAALALKERPASIVAGVDVSRSARGKKALEKLAELLGCSKDVSFFGAVDNAANARGARDILGVSADGKDAAGCEVVVVVGDVPHEKAQLPNHAKVWMTSSLGKDAANDGSVPDSVDVVLPLAHCYEQAGSFKNLEGRVQGFDAGGIPPGGAERARADYEALAAVSSELGVALPKDLKGLRTVLAARYDFFKNLQNRSTLRSELTVV